LERYILTSQNENKIDTLEEKKKWYVFVKERINTLLAKEKEKDELLLTEVREHVTLAVALLEKIRSESSKVKDNAGETKNKMFLPWEKTLTKDPTQDIELLKENKSRRESE
jgi:hypothetical protein